MASGPPPKLIRVSGTSGSNAARLNGQYKLRKQKVGNRVSYVTTKKQKDKMVIWFWATKSVWMINRESMINTDSAYACVQDKAIFPTLIKRDWQVYDKAAQFHKIDKTMKITVISNSESGGTKNFNTSGGIKNSKTNYERRNNTRSEGDLNQEKEEKEREIEEIKQNIDELIVKVRLYERNLEILKDEREERITLGEHLENDHNVRHNKHKEDREKLASAIRHAKNLKSQTEELTNQLHNAEKCNSFPELLELSKDEENIPTIIDCITNIIQEKSLEEILEILAPSELLCQELIRTAQERNVGEGSESLSFLFNEDEGSESP